MSLDIGAVFANAAAGQAIGFLIGNFLNRSDPNAAQKTLERFLRVLSSDFTNRVEIIVRAAFSEQNFLTMKADVTTAVTAFRAYAVTQGKDALQLDVATQKILDARSLLFAEVTALLSRGQDRNLLNVPDPAEKARVVLQYVRSQEAAMTALQAIAALDITILAKRAEAYPGLNREIVERVNEYTETAEKLTCAYLVTPSFRRWIKWNHTNPVIADGVHAQWFEGSYYVDGREVQHEREKLISHVGDEQTKKKAKSVFESKLQRVYQNDQKLDLEAESYLKKPGNIEEAMRSWRDVKKVFA